MIMIYMMGVVNDHDIHDSVVNHPNIQIGVVNDPNIHDGCGQ